MISNEESNQHLDPSSDHSDKLPVANPPVTDSVTPEAHPANTQRAAFWAALRVRNFRLLWLGEAISMLGDQIYMVALPWLMLQLSDDPFAMGTVLALAGIPRAIFMLIGGALTDRYSPRTIMLLSNLARLALVGAMAALVLTDNLAFWMVYGFALVFGLIDAFFYPAAVSIVPQLLPKEQLQGGNAIIQGTAQLTILLGPLLAGLMISTLGGGSTQSDSADAGHLGIGVALAFDAATFLISALTLWLIRTPAREPQSPEIADAARESVVREIWDGLAIAFRDGSLRLVLLLSATINFLVNGPIIIGIPVLADTRYAEGATAFGIVTAAFGAGALAGTLLAGSLPRPPAHRFGPTIMVAISSLGFGLIGLAFAQQTIFAAAITFFMGLGNGYVNILFMTWLQTYVPQALMGRIMSLLMFSSVGLIPISMMMSGALIAWNITAYLIAAGVLLAICTLFAATLPASRELGVREWGTTVEGLSVEE